MNANTPTNRIPLLNIRLPRGPNQYPTLGLSVVYECECISNPVDSVVKRFTPRIAPGVCPSCPRLAVNRRPTTPCESDCCNDPYKVLDAGCPPKSVFAERKSGTGFAGNTLTARTSKGSTLVAWYWPAKTSPCFTK